MIPQTYPSIVDPIDGSTQMVVYELTNTTGLTPWVDYIPVQEAVNPLTSKINTTDNDGYGNMTFLTSTTGKQAWVDYIPVAKVLPSTPRAWSTDSGGFIPYSNAITAKALEVLRRYGTDAHLYMPGVGYVNGVQAGNWLDSAGTTVATVDNPVGKVNDTGGGSIAATQATTANKPILRKGLVNLLTYSQDFSNAVWQGGGTRTLSQGIDPYGSTSTISTVSVQQWIWSDVAGANGTYTFAVWIKAAAGTSFNTTLSINNYGSSTKVGTASVTVTDTWQLFSVTGTTTAGAGAARVELSGAPNPPVGTQFFRAAVFQGTYTAAQIQAAGGIPVTTTAAASSTAGNSYWQFDGTNDSLALGSVPFQMADSHCVVAGVKPSSFAATGCIYSGSNVSNHQAPYIYFNTSGVAAVAWYDGSSIKAVSSTAQTVGNSLVVSAKRASNLGVARLNGAQLGSTLDMSVLANPSITSTSLGCFNNVSQYFNGNIYAVIAIKGTVSDADLLTLEKWVGTLSGVSI